MKKKSESDERHRPSLMPPCPQTTGQQNQQLPPKHTNLMLVIKTIRSVVLNPILLMTILGVIVGFAFTQGLPEIIAGVLRVSETRLIIIFKHFFNDDFLIGIRCWAIPFRQRHYFCLAYVWLEKPVNYMVPVF